jgi:hypothetical protein
LAPGVNNRLDAPFPCAERADAEGVRLHWPEILTRRSQPNAI